ncbi:sugar phosphate nucleotidyltransferase [Candidatus Mancarchaeum acidiphilum]|uniref:sugar phosphate nucleotidyltransferase n=1 Tax=Candidatus Mancarchaeum acidiphilum TaxID=1920749 RepID=UPI0022B7F750|nr:sugar phosphate nucleotidyltransferase [Candidatus Mancarchaeum acidiphilum]
MTAAGMGTRMAPFTKVCAKALVPIFSKADGKIEVAPIIDELARNFRQIGIKDIGAVVYKDDSNLIKHLEGNGISLFYQNERHGFGHAVLMAKGFSEKDPFILNAEDGILSSGYDSAIKVFEKVNPEALLILRKVPNPQRYGIVEVNDESEIEGHKVYKIKGAEEKPSSPKSDMAIVASYIFTPKIFEALEKASSGESLELTDGISWLIKNNYKVYGMVLNNDEIWLNIGDPQSYYETLKYTFEK